MKAPAVLLVDDRAENLLALEAVLAPLDARLIRAASGEEALRALLEQDVAAILLDVQMPGMDGFETARLIRGRERSAHTPIIFLTALSQDLEHISRGYDAGAVDYLLKPFDPGVLRAKVRVFCDLERHRDAHRRADDLLAAAFDSAPAGLALVDPRGRVLQANPALRRITGRDGADLRGRFAEALLPADRPRLDDLVAGLSALTAPGTASAPVELHMVDASGGAVPVSVVGAAIADADGTPGTIVLQVTDLRERVRAREAQERLGAERRASAEAEGLVRRLEAVGAITDDLDRLAVAELVPELCSRLVKVLGLAGAAVVVLGEDGRVALSAEHGVGADPALLEAAAASGGTPRSLPPGHAARALRVEDRVLGALAVARPDAAEPGEDAVLGHVAERVALIVERAGLHERERLIAATLQQDLLPDALPDVAGLGITAYFASGSQGAAIGGDWYDALALPGGRLGIVVGDVAGRGVAAAARMGELRSVARAYAIEGHGPAALARRMNGYHVAMGADTMTTLFFAVVEPDLERLRFVSAGHVPPLLVPGSGVDPHFLDAAGPPLGVLEVCRFEERSVAFGAGSALLAYTDGLVERRGEVLDVGLARLRDAVAALGPADPATTRDAVLAACDGGSSDDDVTAVVVRAQPHLGRVASFVLTPEPDTLLSLRRLLRRWLAEAGADGRESLELTMAANEAMQNAIEHGNAFADAPITVQLRQTGELVEIEVRDLGHDDLRRPDPDRGRGVALMRALTDEAEVGLGGPAGGVVRLRRRLARASGLPA